MKSKDREKVSMSDEELRARNASAYNITTTLFVGSLLASLPFYYLLGVDDQEPWPGFLVIDTEQVIKGQTCEETAYEQRGGDVVCRRIACPQFFVAHGYLFPIFAFHLTDSRIRLRSVGISMLLNGLTLLPPVFPVGTRPKIVLVAAPIILKDCPTSSLG